jgi:8-oxo-dGTP diphosphatase
MWALPGGFLNMDEELDECARRELQEETGLTGIELRQLFTIGTIGRDPRGRTITVMYYGFAYHRTEKVLAGDDAIAAKWFPVKGLPELAFDHKAVIEKAIAVLNI